MDQDRPQHWRAFDAAWFDKHQATLCRIANAPVIGRVFRHALKLDSSLPLEKLTPDAVHLRQDGQHCVGRFYTYPRYSKLIYNAFKPLWWVMHWWDEIFADRYQPEWSFGFDSLTSYADPSNVVEVQNFDGMISSDGTSFSIARAGSGTLTPSVINSTLVVGTSQYGASDWNVSRTYLKFNLASLPVNNVVTIAALKIRCIAKQNPTWNLEIHPAYMADSATSLTYDDWVATTSQESAYAFHASSLSALGTKDYSILTLNSTGRAWLQGDAGGYTPIVLRYYRDVAGLAVTTIQYGQFAASESTVDQPPFLEITYARAILPNGFQVPVTFGYSTITQTNPIVRPYGIEIPVTFGQPRVYGPESAITLNGFAVNVTFGQPQINRIQPTGLQINVVFGQPQINVIRPNGVQIDVTFGLPVIGRGRVVQLNGLAVNVTFGQPTVASTIRTISPTGIEIPVQFGFVKLSTPYPDGVQYPGPYISRLIDQPIEYGVTKYEFEDGGVAVNVQPCGIRRWILDYDGLSQDEINTLVRHYNAMRGRSSTFEFYHRRDAVLYSNVRYVSMSLPSRTRAWSNQAQVTLEKLD